MDDKVNNNDEKGIGSFHNSFNGGVGLRTPSRWGGGRLSICLVVQADKWVELTDCSIIGLSKYICYKERHSLVNSWYNTPNRGRHRHASVVIWGQKLVFSTIAAPEALA